MCYNILNGNKMDENKINIIPVGKRLFMPTWKSALRVLRFIYLFGAVGAALVLGVTGCGDAKQDTATPVADSNAGKPMEYLLAKIDEGGDPTDGDIKVARFKSLLDQLTQSFKENKQQVSDMTVAAQGEMRKEGVEEPLLDIMEDMNQILPTHLANQSYAEYVTAYITLREKGYSREKARDGVHDLVQAIISK
jgi:hypothetical protein